MPKTNEQIGPYTLIKQLGKGAFGVVWLAEKRTAIAVTKVAIKIAMDEDTDLNEIKREASVWAELGGHTNVLPLIEANIYDDQVVIVSEYAPDGSLESWMKQHGGGAPNIESAVSITMGILSGLEHLHSKKIAHRDLKPANILLQGETPRLADFGLSRIFKTTSQTTKASGTPAYMSPEAFDGKKNNQTDIWAAGIIFYELLTGTFPFAANDYAALVGAIMLKEPAPLPSQLNNFQEIIERALKKESQHRYKTATEMKAALKEAHSRTTSPFQKLTDSQLVPPTKDLVVSTDLISTAEIPFKTGSTRKATADKQVIYSTIPDTEPNLQVNVKLVFYQIKQHP